jgi:hypothetical protein
MVRHRRTRNTGRCGLIDRFVAVNNKVKAITGYSPAGIRKGGIGGINIRKNARSSDIIDSLYLPFAHPGEG